ncbi:MAG: lysophospholipid acyltransferase family protein [Cyclobacteriaceae bacterium]
MQTQKKPLAKRIKYLILFAFVWTMIQGSRLVPRKLLLIKLTFLGQLAGLVLKKEREKIFKNLQYALGDEFDAVQLKKLSYEVFKQTGRNFADILKAIHYRKFEQFEKILEIEGIEHLEEAYNKGNGIILVASHMGPYELLGTFFSLKGFKTSAIATPLKDPRLDKLLVSNRQKMGVTNFPRGKDNIKMVKALKNGELLLLLMDQDTRVNSIFVDFFGKPTYTPIGPAMLSLKTGARLVCASVWRVDNDKLKYKILPECKVATTGDKEKDIHAITSALSLQLESLIRNDLSQWVWMHQRWKTTPEKVRNNQ